MLHRLSLQQINESHQGGQCGLWLIFDFSGLSGLGANNKKLFFERRKHKRFKAGDRLVDCIWSGSRHKAKLIDISEEGMGIETEIPLRINHEIELIVHSEDGKEKKRTAKVVWFLWNAKSATTRAGLEFTLNEKNLIEKGRTFYNSGNYPDAIKAYSSIVDLNPKGMTSYFNRGVVYTKVGDYRQAVNDFRIAARLGHKKAQDLLKSKGIGW